MQRVRITSCSSRFRSQVSKLRHIAIDSVLEVNTCCHLDVHGIVIQISSSSGPNTNTCVIRGQKSYVEELRYHDTDYSPRSLEEVDSEDIQETDAEQPTIPSTLQCCLSEDPYFLAKGNG